VSNTQGDGHQGHSEPVCTTQPVVKPVEQPAASCKQTFNRLSNRLFDRFDNRLCRVNGLSVSLLMTLFDKPHCNEAYVCVLYRSTV